jgi:hypothetical protein
MTKERAALLLGIACWINHAKIELSCGKLRDK